MLLDQTSRLQLLNEIGRVVSSSLDLPSLYETIYQQIGRVMDTTEFFIALHPPDRDIFDIPYHREHGDLYVDQVIPFGNSVTSLVVERGVPLLFMDDEEYRMFARANGLPVLQVGEQLSEGKIWVPLTTGKRTIGALTVQSSRPNAYTEEDVATLSVIASQAAIAIVNAGLYQRSQDNVQQMHALLDVARAVNSSLDLESVLDAVLAGIRQVVPFYVATVLLPRADERILEVVGVIGPSSEQERMERLRQTVRIRFGEGVTGTCFLRGQPIIVPDVAAFPGHVSPGTHSVRSELAVPLKRGADVVGVLDIERAEIDAFTEDDLNLLSVFASQAAIAIENARLYASQRQRVVELQTIQTIVQQLTPLHGIAEIAAVIDSHLKHLIDYHSARLFLLDASRFELLPVVSTGVDISGMRITVGEGLAGWVALHGEPVIISNALEDDRVTHIPGTPYRAESIIGAPLVYEGRVQGVITLSKLGIDQFDENALRLLEIITAQAAIVFDRARLYEELRVEAITDPLTGLYNRRYLVERLKEEESRAGRSQDGLAAIMVDIDRFKGVNDRWGHDAGDVVLQTMAEVIRGVVRGEDIVARYGGEEFCVLVPAIAEGEAERVAERVREMIERAVLPPEAGVEQVTVSVGVAHRQVTDAGTALFHRADQAMYQAKRQGGNQVVIAECDAFQPFLQP